ncbi:MAG: hypothetical protein ACO1NS_10215 [Daejeonella sp.]|uniref:hypothetical protein n=1 Tax=Daejeonella sp. JGW-45 TaxID=3034148 RepID=UPI0023ED5C48|nr:hypothetical protein [Daejeonella sp. JGW-45]
MKQSAFLVLLFTVILSACTKDDNEPLPKSTVSRLYVSNADTDTAVPNLFIFDPADSTSFPKPYQFDSKLPDGNGIVFDPYSGIVYQVSRQERNIRSFSVETDGTLSEKGSFIDERLPSAREIAFDRNRKSLYVSSDSDSAIYVYGGIDTLRSTVRATKKLKINDGRPWGIHLEGENLFVALDQGKLEVLLFENASALQVGLISANKRIAIAGATRLHGITYSSESDVLMITDIGDASSKTDGAIYIIEEAAAKFTAQGSQITPTRTIRGVSTGLGNPVDIAFDKREGKGLIYVAEKANNKILVFKLADNGNVDPFMTTTLSSSPEAIYLDAR